MWDVESSSMAIIPGDTGLVTTIWWQTDHYCCHRRRCIPSFNYTCLCKTLVSAWTAGAVYQDGNKTGARLCIMIVKVSSAREDSAPIYTLPYPFLIFRVHKMYMGTYVINTTRIAAACLRERVVKKQQVHKRLHCCSLVSQYQLQSPHETTPPTHTHTHTKKKP